MADETEKTPEQIVVTYKVPDRMPILFADAAIVQNSADRGIFYLSFFQNDFYTEMPAPPVVGSTCIARLALSPQNMAGLIDLLQRNFKRFQEAVEQEYREAQLRGAES